MARNALLEKQLEEHAEELAVRKAEEEEARRKRSRTTRVRRNGTESNAARTCTSGRLGTF
ncbi:hypothetical protein C356_01881 [Cryptococcus neoformans c45]|nr:hypothetical protein C356_01881 [Cryptococcus neoformans var. grubii c45]